MAWVGDHLPHILGGGAAGGGGAAVLAIFFKDAIKDWWADFREDRQVRREAARLERTKSGLIGEQLIEVLREDLRERRTHERRVVELLDKLTGAQERLETKQDAQGRQLDTMHQRVIRIQSGLGGAFQ